MKNISAPTSLPSSPTKRPKSTTPEEKKNELNGASPTYLHNKKKSASISQFEPILLKKISDGSQSVIFLARKKDSSLLALKRHKSNNNFVHELSILKKIINLPYIL